MKVSAEAIPRGTHTDLLAGMLSAFMGFIEEGDEVIIFEPFFDQ
jgi:hypothetical protein